MWQRKQTKMKNNRNGKDYAQAYVHNGDEGARAFVEEDEFYFVYKKYNGEMSMTAQTDDGTVRFNFTKKMMERMMKEMEN